MNRVRRPPNLPWARRPSSLGRLGIAVGLGIIVASATWAVWRTNPLIPLWIATSAAFVGWTWGTLGPMDSAQTSAHAGRADGTHALTFVVVITAALGSLLSVLLVLFEQNEKPLARVTLVGVVLSWTAIHTLFATHYARLYFSPPVGGIDYNQDEPPVYTDFAYTAFTIGMSFAISDTNISGTRMRRAVLVHGLLSYMFGTVIVALLVNLIAGIAS